MRVLLVNGYAVNSTSGRQRYDAFHQHVLLIVKEIERQDVTQIDLIEKTRQDLGEFVFEMHSEFAEPRSITNFDRLDFVLVVGDPSAAPWAPAMRQLVLLTKMCMMTGKCFYGSGVGAALLAFVCSTAGDPLQVINNSGRGSRLDGIRSLLPLPSPSQPHQPPSSSSTQTPHQPPSSSSTQTPSQSGSSSLKVWLETRTGDFFAFDSATSAWTPRGNTGLMIHTSDHAHDYGAKLNTARGGTKPRRHELSHALYASKRGDTRCCCRLDASSHALFGASGARSPLLAVPREFLVSCKSVWDLDEQINTTGTNQFRVLVDSSRGPMLIEFGNCVGAHFPLSPREYPASGALLRNFVFAKYEFFKVHEHIDRGYVSALAGSARLRDRLQLATSTKTTMSSHVIMPPPMATATMTSGKTSPKRCRPVSAGPLRSTAKLLEVQRPIQTSRSEYPSPAADLTIAEPVCHHSRRGAYLAETNNQSEVRAAGPSACPVRPHTARPSVRLADSVLLTVELRPETESPVEESPVEEEEPAVSASPTIARKPIKAHRRIRVAQKNQLEKPYCAIDKFNALHDAEKAQHKELYYSVVNDAPYMSASEREQLEHQQDKLKWIAGPFRTAVGKASTQPTEEVGIFTRTPFNQRNLPSQIIQRRALEPPLSPRSRLPAENLYKSQAKVRPKTSSRPASAMSTRVRIQR